MNSPVKLKHPKLEGRVLEVDPLSVKHYERSGWVRADKIADARRRASEETK